MQPIGFTKKLRDDMTIMSCDESTEPHLGNWFSPELEKVFDKSLMSIVA
jgi:hypothetical protein